MPARKTIAERKTETTRRRSRLVMTVIGAIPIVILVVIGGVFLYQRSTELGADELPSLIGQGEREDIQDAIQLFYDAVNQYNPQLVVEGMALDEGGIRQPDLLRLTMEISALLSEQLKFTAGTLGAVSIDKEAESVTARVVTNFGTKDFVLKRRDGQWRVVRQPDLSVPQEAGPLRLEWEVLNSFRPDDGKALNVAGRIKNTGDRMGFMLNIGAHIDDGSGGTLAAGSNPLPGSPFLHPGEEAYFQVSFRESDDPAAAKLDPARVVIVPDFRPAGPADEAVVVKSLRVNPKSLPWRAGGGLSATVANDETREVETTLVAYLRDASGRFLGVLPLLVGKLGPGEVRTLEVPASLPSALAGVATLDLNVYGAVRR